MTASRYHPSSAVQRRPPSEAWQRLASILLGLGATAVTASPATATVLEPPLMHGELLVQAHSGAACARLATPPLQLPVWAVWEDRQWWLWGDMAPMRLRPSADSTDTADLLAWNDDTPQGVARWADNGPPQPEVARSTRPAGTTFTARWQENETPKGCAFTAAKLRLSPWGYETSTVRTPATSTLPTAANLLAQKRLLKAVLAHQAALQSAASAREAAEPLHRLLGLARQASALPFARHDRNLALAWVQSGERASALRQHEQALVLLQAAVAVYEPLAPSSADSLQHAALALSSLARAQIRARQPQAAQESITRALELLESLQGSQSAAAASLLNQQGALWLRQRRAHDALDSFARAIDVDKERNAPVTERVASLMNYAVAMEELGQIAAARAVYGRCQQLLAGEQVDAEGEQLKRWVRARLQALGGPEPTQFTDRAA